MPSRPSRFRIVAPATAASDLRALAEAGADEIYCGVLPADWVGRYGDWDSLTRRQGTVANLSSLEDLRAMAREAQRTGIPAALALNVRYSAEQVPSILDLATHWEMAGGTAVLVSEPAVLLGLNERRSRLRRHLSILAGAGNIQAVALFADLSISRVVLPRELSPMAMRRTTRAFATVEFEAMALHDRCPFVDGLCGFYHGHAHPRGTACAFDYERAPDGSAIAWSNDPGYTGHGCQLALASPDGAWVPRSVSGPEHPHCAACALPDLAEAGVDWLKIGGRGLPLEDRARSVRYLRAAVNVVATSPDPRELRHLMRSLYAATFGRACDEACYYPTGA